MRQMLFALLLAALLVGCGAPVTQSPAPTGAPSLPTSVPTPQTDDKLPALDSGQWRELGQGHFTANGFLTKILYLPAELSGDAAFAANYAPEQVAVATAMVVVQEFEASQMILLRAGRAGIAGDVLLWRAPQSPPLAAYMVAFDPGSSFLLNLLPLGADGAVVGAAVPLNWNEADSDFRIVAVPAEPQGAELPAVTPSGDDFAEIGQAVQQHLLAEGLERPAVTGATARAGDYAAAMAGVFGEERPRHLVLRRDEAGAWAVILDTPEPTAAALAELGAPESLAQEHELDGLYRAAIAHLQDPRGQGLNGHLLLHRLDQGYAKLTLVPVDPLTRDPFTMFFGPGEGGWRFLTGGTAFMGPELDALGVPLHVR